MRVNIALAAFLLLFISVFADDPGKGAAAPGGRAVYRIIVNLPDASRAEKIQLSVAPLKYNKDWAIAFTGDDGHVGFYSYLQRYANNRFTSIRKTVFLYGNDKGYYYHDDTDAQYRQGIYAGEYKGATDGCGNIVPFKFGVAPMNVWVKKEGGALNPYFSEAELQTFSDFGGGVYCHESGTSRDPYMSIRENLDFLKGKLGVSPTVEVRPNGDNRYLEAIYALPEIKCGVSGGAYKTYQQEALDLRKNDLKLEKIVFPRSFGMDKAQADTVAMKRSGALVHFGTHEVFADSVPSFCQGYLEWLHKTYGAKGDDSVWPATIDEIWQYNYMRQNTAINRWISNVEDGPGAKAGTKVVFDISIGDDPAFRFKELSFLIAGATVSDDIRIYGRAVTKSTANNGSSVLLNIGWNDNDIRLAEKYTAIAEAHMKDTYASDYASDARYFINRLNPALRQSFLNRLGNPPAKSEPKNPGK
ncbi:MAG TPA: hypothetical protein DET40_04235 [Lentisphaeria bacterium]|nr:MAG: hypothetical protein A2X45_06480 [Lentisphaerae bacterium GWF2_50_93]HCE42734.1 hypothetical protein [Lentisphaeria bacterium]